MKHSLLALTFILLAMSFNTHARKPAVEDVFTVIPAEYQVLPKGSETPVNFNKKIPTIGKMDKQGTPSNRWVSLLGLLAMIALPTLMWFALTSGQQTMADEKKEKEENNTSNVSNLDDYRKDHDEQDDHKQAS